MDLQALCTNCLNGTLQSGVCSYCHKSVSEAAKRPPAALPERYRLGDQYYLGRVMGNGGFGITYLAWDWRLQRRVIVKELFPRQDVVREPGTGQVLPLKGQEAYYEKLKQRFREEAQVLYRFRRDPSIVNVYQLIEDNNTVYYSMEYLSGFDLRAYMEQQGKLGWEQLSSYARNLLHTLTILHGQGLIHRDISPDNIFLTSMTEAKLIDFGSARNYNNGQGLTTILKQAYAPVEQYFTNGSQGPWTDVYSFCATMYHALSGVCPPKAPDRAKKDGAIIIERLCPELPAHVAAAITRGMAVRAEKRFQTAKELAAALFPEGMGNSVSQPGQQPAAGTAPGTGRERIPGRMPGQSGNGEMALRCMAGLHAGRRVVVPVGACLSFGRNQDCDISYPQNSPGISRRQFALWHDPAGGLCIRDEHSSYGTVVSGCRLEPGKWYRLARGSIICFAGEQYAVE